MLGRHPRRRLPLPPPPLQVIEPGFVATEMVVHNERLLPERMIRPEDVAEAALLPLRLGPNAVPLELVLKVTQSPYKATA